jgi:hypothetical protein
MYILVKFPPVYSHEENNFSNENKKRRKKLENLAHEFYASVLFFQIFTIEEYGKQTMMKNCKRKS